MTEPNRPLSALFLKLADLAAALGIRAINKLPGCWEFQIDEQWWVAVNGHDKPTMCGEGGNPVPAFCAYLTFNGWPAGVIDPFGGVLAAGELANEAALTRAIDLAIRRIKERPAWVDPEGRRPSPESEGS